MPRGGFRRFIESLSSAFTKKPFEKWLGSTAKGSRSGTAAHRACKRTTQIGSCTERPIRILAVIACVKKPTKGWRRSTSPRCRLRVRTRDPVSQGRDTEAELGIGCSMQIESITTLTLFRTGLSLPSKRHNGRMKRSAFSRRGGA